MFRNPSLSTVPGLATRITPAVAPKPHLMAWNQALADELGIDCRGRESDDLARIFSGPADEDGVPAFALAYAGHQFGQFVPQLGDGRAALIGEVTNASGARYDVQLKGSGRTPYSRGGDGKSALGPVVREYIVSEAMHALGIPTTRALAAVVTGERVYRDAPQPGGVLTRVAASHLRVGTFQYFAARNDAETVRALAENAIARHYPDAADQPRPIVALLAAVSGAQARLVADWMSVGFVHGVMNTDNCSIAGETLDYGPCAFLDEFRHDKVFSSIDHAGRYAFSNQPLIAQWNLARLAECLLLIDDQMEAMSAVVEDFTEAYEAQYLSRMRAKLGLASCRDDDAALIRAFLDVLEEKDLDYTLSFRRLADRVSAKGDEAFGDFENRWRDRLALEARDKVVVREVMNQVNPLTIARNHQVERAISQAVLGDFSVFEELNDVLGTPFVRRSGLEHYSTPPAPEERVARTFCGT